MATSLARCSSFASRTRAFGALELSPVGAGVSDLSTFFVLSKNADALSSPLPLSGDVAMLVLVRLSTLDALAGIALGRSAFMLRLSMLAAKALSLFSRALTLRMSLISGADADVRSKPV